MLRKELIYRISNARSHIQRAWHNLYFHWQLKEKSQYAIIAAILIVSITIPTFSYHLVENKKIQQQIHCLALNIYHEARGEKKAGQIAVAKVTLNRVKSNRYPDTVCDVVYEKRWDKIRKRYVGQFPWTEFEIPPTLKSKAWYQAWNIAELVYQEKDKKLLQGALFYHAKYIKPAGPGKKSP